MGLVGSNSADILFFFVSVCESPVFCMLFIGGELENEVQSLNYVAADCQVELRTMGRVLKYGSLCVCEGERESTLVNVLV